MMEKPPSIPLQEVKNFQSCAKIVGLNSSQEEQQLICFFCPKYPNNPQSVILSSSKFCRSRSEEKVLSDQFSDTIAKTAVLYIKLSGVKDFSQTNSTKKKKSDFPQGRSWICSKLLSQLCVLPLFYQTWPCPIISRSKL